MSDRAQRINKLDVHGVDSKVAARVMMTTIFPLTYNGELRADVFIGPFLPVEQRKETFAATMSTLVSTSSEALLIDAQHIRSGVAALGNVVARKGQPLSTIYVTNGDADRWFGAGQLVARFSGARVVATPAVVHRASGRDRGSAVGGDVLP